MPIKQYESKYAKHSMPLKVGKRVIRVEFSGGVRYPRKRGGLYLTNKKSIQEALERHPGFNSKFKLAKTTFTREEQEADNQKELDLITKAPVKEVVDGKIVVEEVSMFQDAKNYFIQHYPELTLAEVKSKVLVRELADKKGISFPNWPKD